MNNKISQVGVFVVIGMILIVVGIFSVNLFFNDRSGNILFEDAALSSQSVREYVESCIEENSVLGTYLLSYQGGFIYEFDPSLLSEYYPVAYHLRGVEYTSPSREFMQEELSAYMESSVELCLDGFDESYLELEYEYSNVTTTISRNYVTFEIEFPIVIENGEDISSVEAFSYQEEIRLGHLLNIKKNMLETIREDSPYVNLEDLTIYDADISFGAFNDDSMIFTLGDTESEKRGKDFEFNFATKGTNNSNPTMDFVPDFVVGVNEEFYYNLSAYDIDLDDSLIFYSKNDNVLVDKDSGRMKFIGSNEVSNSDVEVCVRDNNNAEDCYEFLIRVRENEY